MEESPPPETPEALINELNMERLRVKRLSEHAVLPAPGTKGAAGYDLSAAHPTIIPPHGKALVKTDLAVVIPPGHYGRIAPRSGFSWKKHTDIGAGVVDSDYRGNVGVVVFNHSAAPVNVSRGDRIAQLILEKISLCHVIDVGEKELDTTCRGEEGFGSTGT